MAVADYTNLQSKILRKTIPAEATVQNTAGTDLAVYEEQLIERAETSTQAALLISQIVLGKVPVDGAKLTSLTAFAQAQFDAYSAKGVARPELGPYEALGVGFSSTPEFAALSAGNSNGQFITNIYVLAFGVGPGDLQVQHFQNQITYFTNLYTNAGVPAATAALQARGAVLGQIVGEAATQEGSTLDNQAEAWLRAAADGTAVFDAPIGDSDPNNAPPVPVDTTRVLTTGIDVIVPTADVPLDGNDTLLGNGQTIQSTDTADLGDGFDKANLVIEPTSLLQLLSVYKLTLTNIEQVNVTAGNTISAVIPIQLSADNWTGVQEFWMRDSNLFGTAGVVVDDIQSNMALGFDDYQGTATYLYDNGGLGANATVDVILQDASLVALNTQTQAATDEIGRLNLTVLGAGNAIGLNLNTNGGAGGNDGLSQLHLFGDGFITLAGEGELNSLTVLDGSAHSGGWFIDLNSTAALAAIGGIGDDFLDFDSGFSAADGFDGGDGDDTLEVDVNSGQLATSANVQNVEHFRVTGDLSADRVFTNSAGFQDIALQDGATTFAFFPDNNLRLIDFDSIIIEDDEEGLLEVVNTGATLIDFAVGGDVENFFGTAVLDVAAAGDVTISYSGPETAEIDNLVLERFDGFTTWNTSSLAFSGSGHIEVDNVLGDGIGLVDLSAMSGQIEFFDDFDSGVTGTDFLIGAIDGGSQIVVDSGVSGVSELVFLGGNTGNTSVFGFDVTAGTGDVIDLAGLGVSSLADIDISFDEDGGGDDVIITLNSNPGLWQITIEEVGNNNAAVIEALVASRIDFDGVIG